MDALFALVVVLLPPTPVPPPSVVVPDTVDAPALEAPFGIVVVLAAAPNQGRRHGFEGGGVQFCKRSKDFLGPPHILKGPPPLCGGVIPKCGGVLKSFSGQ